MRPRCLRLGSVFILLLSIQCTHKPVVPTEPVVAMGPTTPGAVATCKQQKDVRSVQVRPRPDGSCELYYTKFGSEKAVASGGIPYCQKVSERIQTQLVRAGFICE